MAGFRLNRRNLERVLNGPNGFVARDLARRAGRVEAEAKKNITRRPGVPSGRRNSPGRVDTGTLRSSITWQMRTTRGALSARVGTNIEYAPYVEYGTRYMEGIHFLRDALDAAGGNGR